jgi:ring-1,2-phenylacetyl-CoA epoxidase subunit PaaC
MAATTMAEQSLLGETLLRLADTPLILAQRLCEWVGKAPVIEEDLALTNVGLDLLGEARSWLGYAGEVEARERGSGRDEDAFAFLRDVREYRNLLLVEQPNGNYADTLGRQFLFDSWHLLLLRELARSGDERIAAIAAKSVKEATYHVDRTADWVIRLGDGTDLSHARMQAAIDACWPYTGELFAIDAVDQAAVDAGFGADPRRFATAWRETVERVLSEATLAVPTAAATLGVGGRGGRQGYHSEHLGHLLAELQFIQRAYPGARW